MLIDFNYQVFVYILILFNSFYECRLKYLATNNRESSPEYDFRIQEQ